MPKILVVANQEFEFPLQGDSPDYGESVTDWATAVTGALTTVQQPNDIANSSAIILNNQLTFANINGFTFNTSEVVSINSEFIVKRSTSVPAVNLVESGFIQGNFDGAVWTYTIETVGNAGIEFDLNSAGQLRYKSTPLTGTNYIGSITFKAKVFNS